MLNVKCDETIERRKYRLKKHFLNTALKCSHDSFKNQFEDYTEVQREAYYVYFIWFLSVISVFHLFFDILSYETVKIFRPQD